MDYEQLKGEVKEIVDIVSSIPEPYRDKCFELLLSNLLHSQSKKPPAPAINTPADPPAPDVDHSAEAPAGDQGVGSKSPIPMKAQLRVLLRKTGVTIEDLEKVLLCADGGVHFIAEPSDVPVAQGQIEWALLIALKNAILNDSLSADPEEVRSVCQDKGFYDRGNFSSNFKRGANLTYFKGALVPQGEAQSLTLPGQDALGKLVKRLASQSQ